MKVLVLSRGVVGQHMASSGVRAYHIARVLAEQLPEAEVMLSVPNEADIQSPHPRLRIVPYRNAVAGFMQMWQHDVIISRNFPLHLLLLAPKKRLALDFYVSFYSEWLALSQRLPKIGPRRLWMNARRHLVNLQLTMADFTVCSNNRQRDVLVGALCALGLVSPADYEQDPMLRQLIDVVPYGVAAGSPKRGRVLKGVVPGIGENDTVLIWNGSLMEWFDAQTVIRAMAQVVAKRDDVKLFFLGTEHPDKVTGVIFEPLRQTIELSRELELYGRSVFFNEGWVPYNELPSYLAEADIGVCASFENHEARYAVRTRFADLLGAGLPIVCTRGDDLAERVENDPLGIAVGQRDVNAYAAAILRLAEDEELRACCRRNIAKIKEDLSWERIVAPLVTFCRAEHPAGSKQRRIVPMLRRAIAHAALTTRYLAMHKLLSGRGDQARTI